MLDSTVEALRSALSSRYPSASRGKSEIESGELPTPIASFLAGRLHQKASAEIGGLAPSNLHWIDGSAPDVRRRFDAFAEAALAQARIPTEEWDACLSDALDRAVSAILSPGDSLWAAVFINAEETLSRDEILSRLQATGSPKGLVAAVSNSVAGRSVDSYSSARFRSTVEKVDDLRTDGFTASAWLQELLPLADLLKAAGLPEAIPGEELAHFLSHRGCAEGANLILESAGSRSISIAEALGILHESADPPEATTPAEQPVADTGVQKELTLFPEAGNGSSSTAKPADKKSVPLWQRFQKDLNAPMGSQTPRGGSDRIAAPPKPAAVKPTEPPRTAPNKVDAERTQTPLWQQYRSDKPKATKAEPDLHELELAVLGSDAAAKRRSFIGELFDGEEDAYLSTIRHLARTRSWGEASQIIAEEVFKKYQINIYSEPAVAFTNAVEAKFRTRGVGA